MPKSSGQKLKPVSYTHLDVYKRQKKVQKKSQIIGNITTDTEIEPNFVCSGKHRAFFKEHIGNGFSFNVAFQKWLKSNTGKTYADEMCIRDRYNPCIVQHIVFLYFCRKNSLRQVNFY